jgi:hypothetical protein
MSDTSNGTAVAATITVAFAAHVPDPAQLQTVFGDGYESCRFSLMPAPGTRGTEIHVTSHELNQKELKAGLRKYRALVEAGEIPTGARR